MVSKFMEDSTYVTGRVMSFQTAVEGEKSGFRHENCRGGCPIISGEHKVKKMTQCVYPNFALNLAKFPYVRPGIPCRGSVRILYSPGFHLPGYYSARAAWYSVGSWWNFFLKHLVK